MGHCEYRQDVMLRKRRALRSGSCGANSRTVGELQRALHQVKQTNVSTHLSTHGLPMHALAASDLRVSGIESMSIFPLP